MNVRQEALSELVARRIDDLGISQVDYAIRMGVERSVLHNVLTGKSVLPKEPFRRKLASDLGISVLDIFVMAGELLPEDIQPITGAMPHGRAATDADPTQPDSLYFWRDRQVGVAVGSSCGHPGRARSRSHGGMAQQERGCLISIRS